MDSIKKRMTLKKSIFLFRNCTCRSRKSKFEGKHINDIFNEDFFLSNKQYNKQ